MFLHILPFLQRITILGVHSFLPCNSVIQIITLQYTALESKNLLLSPLLTNLQSLVKITALSKGAML